MRMGVFYLLRLNLEIRLLFNAKRAGIICAPPNYI